ncbi:MAG: TIGR01212 family radical SAM protein [Porphyromonadaceae bacterium]|nr:MAG: TIGR01212 family radical SAM protein [Porphyromonadaceae bacterium]
MNVTRFSGLSFPWGHSRPFNDLSGYLKGKFGTRVQKLSIDAGFTCPNRDGSKGTGGCTFCNNKSFNPGYCSSEISVNQQIKQGMTFFSAKYQNIRYLAYFQAYTNTYSSLDQLINLYNEALNYPGISGIVVGTRPDCISSPLLDYFEELAKHFYVSLEFGVESTLEKTLVRVNRGHDYQESIKAIEKTANRGIHVGAHLILGLPGETVEDMLNHSRKLSLLPLNMLKIHQLQIIRGTRMESEYLTCPEDFVTFSADEYIDLVIRFLELLNPAIMVERFASASPADLIAGKRWGLKNFEIVAKIEKEMISRNTWQGRLFSLK